jgi:hypothetical protein
MRVIKCGLNTVRNAARQFEAVLDEYAVVSSELRKLDEAKAAIKSDAYKRAIQLRCEEVSKKAAEKAREEQCEREYQASRKRG